MTATEQVSAFQGIRQSAAPATNNQSSPPHRGYRHEALLYRGATGFVDAVAPFVRDGLNRGQPVMVAAARDGPEALRAALGEDADRVPSSTWPCWGVTRRGSFRPGGTSWTCIASGRQPATHPGVGEPLWAGRRSAEVDEGQFHEALLNLAISTGHPVVVALPVRCRRPRRRRARRGPPQPPSDRRPRTRYRGSTSYGGAYHVGTCSAARFLVRRAGPKSCRQRQRRPSGRDWVRRWAEAPGLTHRDRVGWQLR